MVSFSGIDEDDVFVSGAVWDSLRSDIEFNVTLIVLQIYHQIVLLSLYEVLKAVLLTDIHKKFGCLIFVNDWISGSGLRSYVVSPWDCNLNIEVNEASCAPAKVIFGEVETYSIADDILILSLLDLIYSTIEREV